MFTKNYRVAFILLALAFLFYDFGFGKEIAGLFSTLILALLLVGELTGKTCDACAVGRMGQSKKR